MITFIRMIDSLKLGRATHDGCANKVGKGYSSSQDESDSMMATAQGDSLIDFQ
jgi:hypothetical protein